MKLEELKSYELISDQEIRIGNFVTGAVIMKHKKSGARVVLMPNDDENKVFYIAFRTPPHNSTGVAHILEHSVLCGSKKFPLKDPFVELAKGSPNTFLNAMTYPDKTVYPVASCNDKDFQNLIDVYLDAVFCPNIYKNKAVFLQEGWHYEFDEEENLSYNGVVYNEMKGAFSDADEILDREIQSNLYPNTTYAVEYGGDPEVIPSLSYEEFLAFHQKYYHPSNSYIYLYGKMDMAEKLQFIDEEYLSAYERQDVDSEIQKQEAFEEPRREVKEYPVEEDEDSEEKSYLSVNYSVGDNLDPELSLAFQILDRVIINNNGTPLRIALFDAGLGKDVYSSYDDGIKQPIFSIIAKDADPNREKEFLDIVRTTLEKIVREGFDKKALRASLDSLEFKYLEADYGRYPKGLMYGLNLLSTWIHDDLKPFIQIDANAAFRSIREKINTGYFEELVEKYLLQNSHELILIMNPKRGLLEEQEEVLEKKLAAIRRGMSEEDLESVKKDLAILDEYQNREDTKEELECLPILNREDLRKEAAKLYNEELKIGDTPFLYHDVFTNGIGYLSLGFWLKDIPEEYYRYIGFLKLFLMDVSTQNHDYGDLSNEIDLYAGGMNASISVINRYDDPDDCKTFLNLNAKFMIRNLEKVMELLEEIAFTSQFDDAKRLLEIIREYKTGTQQSMVAAGHSLAVNRALSYLNAAAAHSDVLNKLTFYRLVSKVEENYENEKQGLIQKIKMLCKMIFRPENMQVDYIGAREDLSALIKAVESFQKRLYTCEVEKGSFTPTLEKKNEGFMEPSQVQYVCRAGNFRKKGLPYDGSLRALKVMLGYEYLWTNVRVKNGAYDCMCNFASTGESYFVSYRDPQLPKTVEVYEKAVDYIRNFQADDRTMTKYVIGAIGELDIPMTPSTKGSYSRAAYYAGITEEMIQKNRDELLATTPEKIRGLAKYVEAFLADECFVVAGNSGKIKENEKMFGRIENLF